MRKSLATVFMLTALGIGAFAEAAPDQLKLSSYLQMGTIIGDSNGDTGIVGSATVLSADFKAEYNGTGIDIGSTNLLSYQGAYLLPGTKWQRYNAYTAFWDGLLTIGAGAFEVRDFTAFNVVGQTSLAGKVFCQGNDSLMKDNPLGVLLRVKPIEGLEVGGFMPIATPSYSNGAYSFATMTSLDAMWDSSFALKYKVKGLGAFSGGYQPYNKDAYIAYNSLGLRLSLPLTFAVGYTYDWNDAAPVLVRYQGAMVAKSPAATEKHQLGLTAAYTMGSAGEIDLDLSYAYALPSNTARVTQSASLVTGAIRGQWNVIAPLSLRLDLSASYNSDAAEYYANPTRSTITGFSCYPQVILNVPGMMASANLGFNINPFSTSWFTVPLLVKVSF